MNHVVGSIQREYNKLFQEDNDDHDDMELENRTKKLKNKFNNDIKTEYAQYEEKVDETKDKDDKNDYKPNDSAVNLPLISHDSSSKGRATSPPSLSSTYDVFPPIILQVHLCTF